MKTDFNPVVFSSKFYMNMYSNVPLNDNKIIKITIDMILTAGGAVASEYSVSDEMNVRLG